MKTIYKLALALLGSALVSSCEWTVFDELRGQSDSVSKTVNTPAINVTTEKLAPNTDESGSVRAYIGTEVTAKGFNLDKVSKVTFDDVEAAIVEQDIKTLVFEVPAMDLAQSDDPHKVFLQVYDADGKTPIFKYDYFVTVPVTDAIVSGFSPKSGTVGTEVTISGRNLAQITKVTVGGVDATVSDKGEDAVKILIPALPATAAVTSQAIAAVWAGGTIDVTAGGMFSFNIPVFDAFTQSDNARPGDEFSLSGTNLDLVGKLMWGTEELLMAEQSSASITFKIPSGIETLDPPVQSKALTAVYGEPAQDVTVAAAFAIDTSPVGPAAPVFSSVAPTDTGYDKIYLGRELTVKGENFASIEKFEIDGIEVELSEAATDIEARFVVPGSIKGTSKKSVSLVAVWNGGNKVDFGTVDVYPFYFTKGLRLRLGSNSSSSYPAENSAEAFLLLDEGKVVSVADFKSQNVDPFALSGTNSVVTAANKAAAGKEDDYYSVQPYTFAIANSSHKLSFCDPGNSNSQLKCHRDGSTALPSTFGTPVIYFVVVSDATLKASVSGGTLDDIAATVAKGNKAAPAYGTDWSKGDVLSLQYVTYAKAAAAAKPDDNLGGVRKTGYIVVRDITCVSGSGASTDRVGYIDFDLYWSNVLE